MKLNIKAIEIEITPAIQSYVEKKLAMLKKLLVRQEKLDTIMAKVELGKITRHHRSGPLFKAEAHLRVGKEIFNASATAEDLYAAIDMVKDELSREIASSKQKKKVLVRKGARAIKKILKGAN